MHIRILAALAGCLCFTPPASHAAACDGFVDVDGVNAEFCSAVAFIKDKGVTVGCTDSNHYCPNDFVTRMQMALFMQRLARGGPNNVLPDASSVIGGGEANEVGAFAAATIAGGIENHATGTYSSIGGGSDNAASGDLSTIAGGSFNWATNRQTTVGGGGQNHATGDSAVVPGGHNNTASGESSFAAGAWAMADQDRCVVFSLWDSGVNGMPCFGTKTIFRIGATHGFSVDYGPQRPDHGGTRWVAIGDYPDVEIATSTGAVLTTGGIWTNNSDVTAKTDFADVDVLAVLDKVAAMPLTSWRYKTESGQRHLGPMAQDFHAAFALGADDKHITTLDESGVALAAIKGLNQKLEAAQQRNDALERRLQALERALAR